MPPAELSGPGWRRVCLPRASPCLALGPLFPPKVAPLDPSRRQIRRPIRVGRLERRAASDRTVEIWCAERGRSGLIDELGFVDDDG